MRDPKEIQIAALEAEIQQLRAENARLKTGKSEPAVTLNIVKKNVRPWIAAALIGFGGFLGYAIN
jgi:hypothetical protein